jgi:hypothetical protein
MSHPRDPEPPASTLERSLPPAELATRSLVQFYWQLDPPAPALIPFGRLDAKLLNFEPSLS